MELVKEKTSAVVFSIFEQQKRTAIQFRTEPLRNRKDRLLKIRNWIHANRSLIHEALYKDFRKVAVEADAIEIFHILNEIKLAVSELRYWAAPKKVATPLTMLGSSSSVQVEPRGVCLILSPWNYPFSLAIGPLVSAIAAGNTAIIKPSEFTPHTSALMKKMIGELFESKEVALIEGDAATAQQLLQLPFDHIFFTGSPNVGKIVMKAAAEHLSSLTLELGGKSPCIVTADAKLQDAAERIVVAKFVNNGQTCIAPDYLLVDEKVLPQLSALIVEKTKTLFGGETGFENSDSYCRIVNEKNHRRLTALLEDAVLKGAKVVFSGVNDESTRFFHPAILSNVPLDSKLMQEEIFGPILPVISYATIDDAITIINERPKPLALYVFTQSNQVQKLILSKTSSGGACVNDAGLHFLNHNLPFGGVNNSGFGKSHGYYGFLTFSNEKPVLKQRNGFTSVKGFYPPYTEKSRKLMEWFLKLF